MKYTLIVWDASIGVSILYLLYFKSLDVLFPYLVSRLSTSSLVVAHSYYVNLFRFSAK